jgi:broad specificity phosphatase PhoE
MASTVHVLRHGEVYNPEKILYGRQSGWHLSDRGKEMAQVVADWSEQFEIGAVLASPLERAQETARPLAARHSLEIVTTPDLIEAENIFEGKKFELGSGVLRHPRSWRFLTRPWVPSWGEPYDQQVERMLRAVFAARDEAQGKDAFCVSHQLPIWILRSFVEGRRLMHDPRRRECSLASVTSFHLDSDGAIANITYSEPVKL